MYEVQALLHTNSDLNIPNAPGDLYSAVQTVRLDPADGRVPISLKLSRSVPAETVPPDTELVKHVKIRSNVLSEFHGRPIHLRRRDPAAQLRARAGSPLPGAGAHRRIWGALHRGQRDDVRRHRIPPRLDGRRRPAHDPRPPRRGRSAGRPLPDRLGQPRAVRRGRHGRADPPYRVVVPGHRPGRRPRARRRLDRRMGRSGPANLLPRLFQRHLVLLPRRRQLPQLRADRHLRR